MKFKYRYQSPIVIAIFRYGLTIAWQHPRVRIHSRTNPQAEDSMLIYWGMFDDED